jgi:hypothetical protein
MAFQSNEEIIRVMDDWARNFCPPNVVKNAKNAQLIAEHCMKKHGILTISGLTEAAHELGAANLELVPAPPVPKMKTADELAAEEIAKQHRDYMKSIAPQPNFEDRVKAEQAKRQTAEATKAQTDAKSQLAVAISGYQAYRVNGAGIDYGTTEMVQKELSTVVSRFPNGQRDYVKNLVVVRQIIQELPDHPKMDDVARTLETLNARLQKTGETK